ncbi:MAG: hypothetical protein ACRC33_29115 [Gemmataceae bacterium]
MPEMTRAEAVERMSAALREYDPLERMAVHNDIFRRDPATREQAEQTPDVLTERLVRYLGSGLDVAELTDVWRLIFVRDQDLWYDEDADRIHYTTRTEAFTGT